jgi:hypothetical protein
MDTAHGRALVARVGHNTHGNHRVGECPHCYTHTHRKELVDGEHPLVLAITAGVHLPDEGRHVGEHGGIHRGTHYQGAAHKYALPCVPGRDVT